MQLKSLTQNYIAVVQEDVEKTEGGLYMPLSADLPTRSGRVLMVGPGIYQDGRLIPVDIYSGEKVVYYDQGGLELKHLALKVKVMRATDVIAKLEE